MMGTWNKINGAWTYLAENTASLSSKAIEYCAARERLERGESPQIV